MNTNLFQLTNLLQILENAPLPIGIYEGPEHIFVFINKVGAEFIRKKKEEILGKPYAEVLPHAKERIASVKKVFTTGEKFAQKEMPVPLGFDDKGLPIIEYVNFLSQPYLDENGKILGVVSFGTPVTAEVLAKRKMEEQSNRTSRILKHLTTGFFSLDKNWNFNYANPASEPALGLPCTEVIGKNVWEIHPHLINSEFYHAYHKSMNERVVVEVSNYYPEQDRWYHTTSYPLDEGIAVSFTDITNRRKAEEARALSDERFHTLTEAMPQMVWITDADGNAYYFNSQWMERTGTTLEDNLNSGWLNVIHPDDMAMAEKAWMNAIQNGIYDIEYRVRMANGTYRWHVARGVPTNGEDGKVKQWVGTTTDIENQKQDQLALEKAVNARDEFLSIASHELKTPLTVIKLQTALTKMTLNKTDKELELSKILRFTDTTEKSVQRLNRIVDDMLDISRISTGKFNLEMEEVNLTDLIKETLERMTPLLNEAGCTIEYKAGEDITVTLDKFRIEQVLINLLTNSARYGKGKPITIRSYKEGSNVVIAVKDQGAGIAKENHQRIFGRFERATKMADVSGLGLGLFIVKNIMDQHHGSIHVESEINQGSEFFLKLPLI